MVRYYNQWFGLKIDGILIRAKCIDIEFETGFGPLLLMRNVFGDKFWLSRKELRDYKI